MREGESHAQHRQNPEVARLRELYRLEILDTPPEEAFDRLVRLASYICGTPISLVTLIDRDRQWLKAKVGLEISETPRSEAVCNHAIQSDRVMVVENLTKDPRFSANPHVSPDTGIRFYAGAPLRTKAGANLGTLCVIDRQPRSIDPAQQAALQDLAAVAVDEMELRAATRKLVGMLEIDPMTGVYNRAHFLLEAEKELARSRRHGRTMSILMFDIDHFKKVNDTWGHAAGDAVIIAVAEAAQKALRREDVLARVGGEEFAVLTAEADRAGLRLVGERIRKAIEAQATIHGETRITVTASVGAAAGNDEETVAQIMARADAALYAAKQSGRNAVVIDGA